jgi:hypothetical protein
MFKFKIMVILFVTIVTHGYDLSIVIISQSQIKLHQKDPNPIPPSLNNLKAKSKPSTFQPWNSVFLSQQISISSNRKSASQIG